MAKEKENKVPLLKKAYHSFKGIKVVQMWITNISFLAFCVSTVFLVLNSTEKCAAFINDVYRSCILGSYTLLDLYTKIHPFLVFSMSYVLIISIVVYIGAKLVLAAIARLLRDRYILEFLGKTPFAEKLYDYLTTKETDKCIVVTAAWGQGKSYQIKRFFKEFMCYRSNHVYTVSCFGVEGREQLYELLENEMYCENTSLDKVLFSTFDHIPVVGTIFTKIREQKYTIKRISSEDIVVLEDIERMSPPGVSNPERLNVLAGFVHELIDRYHNKVILVCNIDDFQTQTYQESIRKKLACEEVTITNEDATIAIMQDCFRQKKIDVLPMGYLEAILREKMGGIIATVLNHAEIRNKRLLQKVFTDEANFIKYARIPDENINKQVTKNIAIDYLFSYLFWEMVQEKEKEIDDELKLLLVSDIAIPFPELYLSVLDCMQKVQKKRNLKISHEDWWQVLIYFPENHYWVGVSALERFAKKTEGIGSGQVSLIKWPGSLINRMEAAFWQALRAENKQMVDETLADLCIAEQEQYNWLIKGYLVETYAERYEYQVSQSRRDFIIDEYGLINDHFTDYAEKYFGVASYEMRTIVDEMLRRREQRIDELDPTAKSDKEGYIIPEEENVNHIYESFSKVVTARADSVEEPACTNAAESE